MVYNSDAAADPLATNVVLYPSDWISILEEDGYSKDIHADHYGDEFERDSGSLFLLCVNPSASRTVVLGSGIFVDVFQTSDMALDNDDSCMSLHADCCTASYSVSSLQCHCVVREFAHITASYLCRGAIRWGC